MPLYRSPFRALAGFQGNNSVSARVFGAKGDGTTNDLPALQAAVDYIKTLPGGGGTLVLDGDFRITGTLQMDCRVSLEGVGSGKQAGGASSLLIDHSLSSILHWPTASDGAGYVRQRIRNLLLGAKQANSSTALTNVSGAPLDLLLDNVTYNEDAVTGLHTGGLWVPGIASRLTVRNSIINQVGTTTSAFWCPNVNDTLRIEGTRFNAPPIYTHRMIEMAGGRLAATANEFNAGASPNASSSFIFLNSANASAAVVGNTFRGFDGFTCAFSWVAGAKLKESDNLYYFGDPNAPSDAASIGFANAATTAILGEGSRVSPKPYYRRESTAPSVAVDEYLDVLSYTCTSSSTVTFTLPRTLARGRRFRLMIKNSTGGALTPVFVPYNVIGGTKPDIDSGKYATYDFIATDTVTADAFVWYMIDSGYSP